MVEQTETQKMVKLPSGREVSVDLVRDVADSIVTHYAMYGFEDFNEAVANNNEYLADMGWGEDEEPFEPEDAAAIIGMVEVIAKNFAEELGVQYGLLYEKYLANWEPKEVK